MTGCVSGQPSGLTRGSRGVTARAPGIVEEVADLPLHLRKIGCQLDLRAKSSRVAGVVGDDKPYAGCEVSRFIERLAHGEHVEAPKVESGCCRWVAPERDGVPGPSFLDRSWTARQSVTVQ